MTSQTELLLEVPPRWATGDSYSPPADLWDFSQSQAIESKVASINSARAAAVFTFGTFLPRTRNADIGGGKYDNATQFLAERGVTNCIFDPFNRPPEHNEQIVSLIQGGQCATATVANVLNVIGDPRIRERVIQQAADAVSWTGTVYVGIYEGDCSGIGRVSVTCKGEDKSWQENRLTASYLPEIEKYFGVVIRKRNLIIATAPRKHAMTFPEYRSAIRSIPFGKRLPQALYVIRTPLTADLDALVARAAAHCSARPEHNLLKFRDNQFKLAFLQYPDFYEDPHPALRHFITFDLATGTWQEKDLSKASNPPIVHRKELFLPPNHPRFAEFSRLTQAEESQGLYTETSHIGFRQNWEDLLARHGVKLQDHQLLACS